MTDVFDRQELLDELDGDREFLEESLEMLDADAPRLIDQIRDGIEGGDAEQGSWSAVAGVGLVFGFQLLSSRI
jgi:hypothetical protein